MVASCNKTCVLGPCIAPRTHPSLKVSHGDLTKYGMISVGAPVTKAEEKCYRIKSDASFHWIEVKLQ